MSDKDQPGANKITVTNEGNKLLQPRTSPKTKQKSNSPENQRKKDENIKMKRPFSASGRKDPKILAKPKDTKEMLLRRDFQIGLNKLSASETREMGMKELQNIISSNTTPQDLRIFLSILCDQKRNLNSTIKEMEVLVFGYIALVFKDNLLDPLDKPPNLVRSVVRMVEAVHSYFKDTSPSLQSACARVLCEIYSNCLQHEPMETARLVIAEPLLSILNGGGDKITQHTAAVCLCEFVYLAKQLGKVELIDGICEKLYNLLLKTHHDFVEFLRAIGISIAVNKLAGLSDKLIGVINKLCGIVSAQNNSNQYYLNKVEACTTLQIIAKVLVNQNVPLNDDLKKTYDKVIELLKDASTHRISRVQKIAQETLKQWELLGKRDASTLSQEMGDKILLPQEEEALKPKKYSPKRPCHKIEVPAANNFRMIRDKFKQVKQEENVEQKGNVRKGLQDFIRDAWGPNKAQNFVRARSGTGGGFVEWTPSPKGERKKVIQEKPKRTTKELIKQYKATRPKTAADDKFSFLPETTYRSKPPTPDQQRSPERTSINNDVLPLKKTNELVDPFYDSLEFPKDAKVNKSSGQPLSRFGEDGQPEEEEKIATHNEHKIDSYSPRKSHRAEIEEDKGLEHQSTEHKEKESPALEEHSKQPSPRREEIATHEDASSEKQVGEEGGVISGLALSALVGSGNKESRGSLHKSPAKSARSKKSQKSEEVREDDANNKQPQVDDEAGREDDHPEEAAEKIEFPSKANETDKKPESPVNPRDDDGIIQPEEELKENAAENNAALLEIVAGIQHAAHEKSEKHVLNQDQAVTVEEKDEAQKSGQKEVEVKEENVEEPAENFVLFEKDDSDVVGTQAMNPHQLPNNKKKNSPLKPSHGETSKINPLNSTLMENTAEHEIQNDGQKPEDPSSPLKQQNEADEEQKEPANVNIESPIKTDRSGKSTENIPLVEGDSQKPELTTQQESEKLASPPKDVVKDHSTDKLELKSTNPTLQDNHPSAYEEEKGSKIEEGSANLANSQQVNLLDSLEPGYLAKKLENTKSEIAEHPNEDHHLEQQPISKPDETFSLEQPHQEQRFNPADERPLNNKEGQKLLPIEAFQSEDALEEILDDDYNTQHLETIRESPEHELAISHEKDSPQQSIFQVESPLKNLGEGQGSPAQKPHIDSARHEKDSPENLHGNQSQNRAFVTQNTQNMVPSNIKLENNAKFENNTFIQPSKLNDLQSFKEEPLLQASKPGFTVPEQISSILPDETLSSDLLKKNKSEPNLILHPMLRKEATGGPQGSIVIAPQFMKNESPGTAIFGSNAGSLSQRTQSEGMRSQPESFRENKFTHPLEEPQRGYMTSEIERPQSYLETKTRLSPRAELGLKNLQFGAYNDQNLTFAQSYRTNERPELQIDDTLGSENYEQEAADYPEQASLTERSEQHLQAQKIMSPQFAKKVVDPEAKLREQQAVRAQEKAQTANENIKKAMEKLSSKKQGQPSDGGESDGISTIEQWQKCLSLIDEGDYETAYSTLLDSGDDIYLLRMMKLTGPCLRELSRPTAMRLMKRMMLLMRSDFMEKIGIGFFENAQAYGVIKHLQLGQQNSLLRTVQGIAKKENSLGVKSSKLAAKIEQDFNKIE